MMVPCDNCEFNYLRTCPFEYHRDKCPMVGAEAERVLFEDKPNCVGAWGGEDEVEDVLENICTKCCGECEDENGCWNAFNINNRRRCAIAHN